MTDVLIVDDSDFDRRMIRKAILAKCPDVRFIELDRGERVTQHIMTENPALTILDVRIPGQDGFDILSAIRAVPDLEDHPVLMVSGSNADKDRALAKHGGANGYFVKPPTASAYFSLGRDICEQYLRADNGPD